VRQVWVLRRIFLACLILSFFAMGAGIILNLVFLGRTAGRHASDLLRLYTSPELVTLCRMARTARDGGGETARWFLPFRIWVLDAAGVTVCSSDAVEPEVPTVVREGLDRHPAVPGAAWASGPYRVLASAHEPVHWVVIAPDRLGSTALGDIFLQSALRGWHIVLAGVLLCTVFVFVYLRRRGRLVAAVIHRLQRGELSARVPLAEMGELAPILEPFNTMAGEIESLVEKLRRAEQTRNNLVRELSHDLRTPLTSLQTVAENLLEARSPSPQMVRENLEFCLQEIDYFRRLIEDLFLLAQVDEIGLGAPAEPIALEALLAVEWEAVRKASGQSRPEIAFRLERVDPVQVRGQPVLLRRLLRNLFENARDFARSEVSVSLECGPDSAVLRVRDDGSGFSPEALRVFGERRTTRFLDARVRAKFSLGLGSVIIKSVANAHRGSAEPGNWSGPGRSGGGEVRVTLPRDGASAPLAAGA
jgi:signal transduction histidine kinase